MKYWKGISGTPKAGQYGTMADDGHVPDAKEIVQAEYDAWAALNPAPAVVPTDIERLVLYAKARGWI